VFICDLVAHCFLLKRFCKGFKLYVSGAITEINGVSLPSSVACFDGISWAPVGNGPYLFGISLQIYRNQLYAGIPGYVIKTNGDSLRGIARWDGSDWQPLGRGVDENVYTMEVYHNELYVGGNFDTAGTTVAHKIARWYMPPAGLEETTTTPNELIISPNPAKDKFKVESKKQKIKQYELYNDNGTMVADKVFSTPANSLSIGLTSFSNGIYFIKATTDMGYVVKKIVKD
jgi:hypothetical protein